jgi:hypothetical protein
MSPQNMPLWHKDYFELKVLEKSIKGTLCPPYTKEEETLLSPKVGENFHVKDAQLVPGEKKYT